MNGDLLIGIAQTVILPTVTAIGGWFASIWRSKQKKEADILDNVKRILELQKAYIEEQANIIKETKEMVQRLEKKLDEKSKSIRKANFCKYTSEGDGCPVLMQEEKCEQDKCESCEYNKENIVTNDQG